MKNMLRATLCFVFCLTMFCSSASATEFISQTTYMEHNLQEQNSPRFQYISYVYPHIFIANDIATCETLINLSNSNLNCKINMILQRKSPEGSWKNIESWSDDNVIRLTKKCGVMRKQSYRLKAVCYVYDSGNNVVETDTAYSDVATS